MEKGYVQVYTGNGKGKTTAALKGLERFKEILTSGKYDVVVMDELNVALFFKLFSAEEAIEIIKNRDENVEVIITGRYAPREIIDIADLVTEMKEIKHYYNDGIQAREGIEF